MRPHDPANFRRLIRWDDVICSPPETWRHIATTCAKQRHLLNVRERDFVNNVVRLRCPPSGKQIAWLQAIYARLHGREHAA
jgi:hypothetical protein